MTPTHQQVICARPHWSKYTFERTASMVLIFIGTLSQVAGQSQWSNGSGGVIYYNGGSVGVGTSTPSTRLFVAGSSSQDGVTADATLYPEFVLSRSSVNKAYFGIAGTAQGWFTTSVIDQLAIRSENGPIGLGIGSNEYMRLTTGGNLGVGTTNPQYKLSVNGTIQGKEVIVNTGWADYVFKPDYRLMGLREVGKYVKEHHHLPDIPSEAEVQDRGVSLGEMQAKLLAKIEELTLHMIHAEESNDELAQQNRELRERIARLESDSATRMASK